MSSDEFFDLSLYHVFRNDRVFAKGGGVLIAVNSIFNVTQIDFSDVFDSNYIIDILGVIIVFHTIKFIIIAIYIPPDISLKNFRHFFGSLLDFTLLNSSSYFLCLFSN